MITTSRINSVNDAYDRLAKAIVYLSISDMNTELKKSSGTKREEVFRYWRKWFSSDYFTMLMDSDGEAIFEQLKKNFFDTGNVWAKIENIGEIDLT